MKTISQSYRKDQLLDILPQLVEDSRWFQVEPLPFDVYAVTAKAERPLPPAVGLDDAGNPTSFAGWAGQLKVDVQALNAEDTRCYLHYFHRGLSPAEAVKQFVEDSQED